MPSCARSRNTLGLIALVVGARWALKKTLAGPADSGADIGGDSSAERDWLQFALAEYATVRDEWLQARNAQHTAIQWSSAALALVIGGLLTTDVISKSPLLFAVGGAIVTAGAVFSSLVWFGEALRMERAALFLRGRERALRQVHRSRERGPTPVMGPPPLAWETFRSKPPSKTGAPWVEKIGVGVVAAAGLYSLFAFTGIVLQVLVLKRDYALPPQAPGAAAPPYPPLQVWEDRLVLGLIALTTAVWLGSLVYLGVVGPRTSRVSSKAADLDAVEWPTP